MSPFSLLLSSVKKLAILAESPPIGWNFEKTYKLFFSFFFLVSFVVLLVFPNKRLLNLLLFLTIFFTDFFSKKIGNPGRIPPYRVKFRENLQTFFFFLFPSFFRCLVSFPKQKASKFTTIFDHFRYCFRLFGPVFFSKKSGNLRKLTRQRKKLGKRKKKKICRFSRNFTL